MGNEYTEIGNTEDDQRKSEKYGKMKDFDKYGLDMTPTGSSTVGMEIGEEALMQNSERDSVR